MKKLLYAIIAVPVIGAAGYFAVNERLPYGEQGPEAEELADKVLSAVNIQGWDSITAVKWTFRNDHKFIWDKKRHLVQVEWQEYKAQLNTKTKKGKAWLSGNRVQDEEAELDLVQKAWALFANDSFWFAAPFKIRDQGTERRLVKLGKSNGLLVTYTSGGVTPGDSYLCLLDEDGRPNGWKMWVNILPIGGLQFSWEGWETFDHDTHISLRHLGVVDVNINDLETALNIEQLYDGEDPFTDFEYY